MDTNVELADRLALQELITRYAQAVDTRDVPGIVGCFSSEASLSANDGASRMTGQHEIEAYFTEAFTREALGPGTTSSHLLTNTSISIDGDEADLVTLGLAALAAPTTATVRLRGLRYTDRCRRIDGTWAITARSHAALWQCEAPGGVV